MGGVERALHRAKLSSAAAGGAAKSCAGNGRAGNGHATAGLGGVNVGGVKANYGHTEPSAGLMGLLALASRVAQQVAGGNDQLRVLNALLHPACRGLRL